MGMIKEGFNSLTTHGKIALAVVFALMMAWCIGVSAIQEAGFRAHVENTSAQAEQVALRTTDGHVVFVDKADYEQAKREYDQAHEGWR